MVWCFHALAGRAARRGQRAEVAGPGEGPAEVGPQRRAATVVHLPVAQGWTGQPAYERVFGSGWVFVTVTRDGKLTLETRPNQDSPLMDGKRVLFGNDVWEHAYYLTYQNRRPDYLKAWWNVANWNKIGERYSAAKSGALAV